MTKATTSSQGQIAIPKAVRERLNLKAGTEVSIDVQGEALVMKRCVRDHPDWHTMRGMFRRANLLKDLTDDRAAEMPASKVVDAWTMIAWLLDQAAASAVEWFIQEADAVNLQLFMSWINVGEVYYIISKPHGPERAEEFLNRLPSLPIRLVLPDEDGILAAAKVKGCSFPSRLAAPLRSHWPGLRSPASSPAAMKSGNVVSSPSVASPMK